MAKVKHHRAVAAEERRLYVAHRKDQDKIYVATAIAFDALMKQLQSLPSPATRKGAIAEFVNEYLIKLYIDLDYQADKVLPQFRDQPGVVYYLNKTIAFLLIAAVHSFGQSDNPDTQKNMRMVYIRYKAAGGSKSLDDTVSMLEVLLTGDETCTSNQATVLRPPEIRTATTTSTTSTTSSSPTTSQTTSTSTSSRNTSSRSPSSSSSSSESSSRSTTAGRSVGNGNGGIEIGTLFVDDDYPNVPLTVTALGVYIDPEHQTEIPTVVDNNDDAWELDYVLRNLWSSGTCVV